MIYCVEDFALDSERRELRRGDALVKLEPQVFDLLEYLIRNRQRVVSKDDIFAAVWSGRNVSNMTQTSRVNAARCALADDGTAQRLIRTFRNRGIRFVGEVREVDPADGNLVAASPGTTADVGFFSNRPSIAVLPLKNLSSDPEQEYIADGITDELITNLSRVRWLFVISHGSTIALKGQMVDPTEVGRELEVQYVLQGSISRQAKRVRITIQLVQVGTGAHIWGQKYDRADDDIFAVQDEIGQMVVSAIESKVEGAERQRAKIKPPESLIAWDYYLQALSDFYQRKPEGLTAAKQKFRYAITLDPDFGQAYAWLAFMRAYECIEALPTADELPNEWIMDAQKAMDIDPENPLPHVSMGFINIFQREFELAAEEGRIAIELNPSMASAYNLYGVGLLYSNRAEQAIPVLEMAIKLSPMDPLSGPFYARLSEAHFALGNPDQAVDFGRMAARTANPQIFMITPLIAALGWLGKCDEAQAPIRQLVNIRPDATINLVNERHPISATNIKSKYIEGLRKAGLPE